jgi:CheY-like chemotaxis protein
MGTTIARAVLLVDDDDHVRTSLARALAYDGYEVTTARDGHEALEFVRAGRAFDLIVSDYEMPRMNGGELLQALLVEAPELVRRTLIITGQRAAVVSLVASSVVVLEKPIAMRELRAALEAVLRTERP